MINPWIVDFAAYDFWIKPVGLLSIGSVLKKQGYDVSLLDCLDRNDSQLLKYLGDKQSKNRKDGTGHFYKEIIKKPDILKSVPRRYGRYGIPRTVIETKLKEMIQPDIIFITSGMTYWYPGVFEMISLLKNRFADVPIVLGGVYATLCRDHARGNSGADRVVSGPGEMQSLKIADEITGNTSNKKYDQNFIDFPAPAYDLYSKLSSAALFTSRGCPYSCSFCASSLLFGGSYQRRNASQVVGNIVHLHNQKSVRQFAFYDDALFYKKQDHIIPILRGVIERKLDIHFHTPNGIQPKEIDSETAILMKKSGFRTIRLSFETTSKERQKQMGFKVTDDDLVSAVGFLKDAGIDPRKIGSYVMMGLPGQELDEILDSMLFVLRLGIKVSLASYSLIPGTRDWQDAINSGLIEPDMDPLLTNNSIFSVHSNTMHPKTFTKLGTLSAVANRLLNQKKDPLNHSDFNRLLKELKKTALLDIS